MSIFAVGDLQGCFDEFLRLLEKIRFDPDTDHLWCTGDLVNRGPRSVDCLRYIKTLGDRAVTVLGNHDLHLLALASGEVKPKINDSLIQVLEAPDCDELLEWLRHRPLAHYDTKHHTLLVHAGIPPQWNLDLTLECAHKVEGVLRSSQYKEFFQNMYGNEPCKWSSSLSGHSYNRFVVNCFTRMRYCTRDGQLDFENKGPVGSQPPHLLPWFELPERTSEDLNIIFGHWSTLTPICIAGIYPVDTGCVWGGKLSAVKIDSGTGAGSGTGTRFETVWIECSGYAAPGIP